MRSPSNNHEIIRTWIEARGGHPARRSAKNRSDVLVDFGASKGATREISWDEFFQTVDESREAFMHGERAAVASRH